LRRLYRSLAEHDAPAPSDLIFVPAGRMERKAYALDLYRAGTAPRLLLSIGRFEVSKMARMGLDWAPELIALRDKTPPRERHFLVEVDASAVRITKPALLSWNTYGEVLGLREYVEGCRRVLVVSTDVHLRRIRTVVQRAIRDRAIDVRYCPVPEGYGSFCEETWWKNSASRRFVLKEAAKLVGYRIILGMPEWVVRGIMRLRR